ncbi:hypothetical protein [Rhodococcus kronopolitis]|uniref:Lipoprotein n=1 Tax=Rhodococcus kronopolitis TaxID=1460226 RepID=A0ABV9FYP8_9NOCA
MTRTIIALVAGSALLLTGCGSEDSSAAPAAGPSCPADASKDDPTATLIAKTAVLPAGVTVDGAVTTLNSDHTPVDVDVTVRLCAQGLDGDGLADAASAVATPVIGSLLGSSLGTLTVQVVGGDVVRSTGFQPQDWDPAAPVESHRAAWTS